eukprot:CAMPEP_0194093038 /NCGR_PEP_ID=MMETSP0149-20130528/48929_1 /TAXON_ID=122233 /ORGANISM="Chaetoceros debilis, Strain MM31A-1" /LENGTH=498 /DNA_ID=CAMNT_0038778193 /DNA_START=124 /DNA_END=1620 /DNA_ORIENTATION=+
MIFTARAHIPNPLGPKHPSMVNSDFLEMTKPEDLGNTWEKSENNKNVGKDITEDGASAADDKNDGKDITKATKESTRGTDAIRAVHKEPESEEPNHHMVFSTDCSEYQQWQSYLLFYYAMKNGQPGTVTRIASGCTEFQGKKEIENHEKLIASQMSSQFRLHLTPEFSKVKDSDGKKTGEKYNFFNKPFGILHWLNEKLESKSISEDDIVILVDPDQIITRPITYDFSNESDHIFVTGNKEWKLKTKVTHGVPFAQKFGFGSSWQKRNIADIAGSGSHALNVSPPEARSHYPAGPPYLATARDFHQIAKKWAEYVPLVHKEFPYLMAEMYAYCIAAAHLKLPHQILTSLMVSDGSIRRGEGWELVEKIPDDDLCKPSVESDYVLPSVLHFCQRYIVGKWFWGKRKMPKDIFTCEMPLLKSPPEDLPTYDYFIPPSPHRPKDERKTFGNRFKGKFDAFMLCQLTSAVNEASTFYKKHNCDDSRSTRYDLTYNLWLGKEE